MKMTEMFIAELEREAQGTRNALSRVPEGQNDWKPHPKSMQLGYLAALVATMPSWIVSMVKDDQFDMRSQDAENFRPKDWKTSRELVAMFDTSMAAARKALSETNDDHLLTSWKFMVGGHVVNEEARHIQIRDSVLSHLVHHRGQLTVYLRLNEAAVPPLYGPTADEGRF